MDLNKAKKLSGRYYWADPSAPLGPDDRPSPPTIAIDLYVEPGHMPPRTQLRAELRALVLDVLRKLDEEFYPRNFVNDVASGRASLVDFDDYLDQWHRYETDQPLHEFLGMTWKDYAIIAQDASRLEEVVLKRIAINES